VSDADPCRRLAELLCANPDEKISTDYSGDPSEKLIVENLGQTITEIDGLWAQTEVNLWSAKAKSEGTFVPPQTVVRELLHPLQPDIDILCGRETDCGPTGPLVGIEAKYFGEYKGLDGNELLPKRIGPRGNPMGGFYSGLGQALSLLSMGLDRVYLWHVFEINESIYDPNQNSTNKGNQTTDHRDILHVYTKRIIDILETYELPIGYFAHGLTPAFDDRLIHLNSRPLLEVEHSVHDDSNRVRSLIEDFVLN